VIENVCEELSGLCATVKGLIDGSQSLRGIVLDKGA